MSHVLPRPLHLSDVAFEFGARGMQRKGDDVEFHVLGQDSRRIAPGALFIAKPGPSATQYLDAAIERGAVAALVPAQSDLEAHARARGIATLSVPDVASVLPALAQFVFGHPARKLRLLGVTGTNGKTTTVTLVRQGLAALGVAAAQLGTLGFECGSEFTAGELTTPGPDGIAAAMQRAVELGAQCFAMEVSSHALAQQRVAGLSFAAVGFSNLTRDHLDFHGSLAEYAATKRRLFFDTPSDARVINVDDATGAAFAAELREAGKSVVRVSQRQVVEVQLVAQAPLLRGSRLELCVRGEAVTFDSELLGGHNVDNLLLAVGLLHTYGLTAAQLAVAAAAMRGAPGRLERCDAPQDDVTVLVDYAHTPDALERVLETCRASAPGRLLVVFGCGGDRDPGKRPLMGAAAARIADAAWITNDNPRTEDPARIAAAVAEGFVGARVEPVVTLDRRLAIEAAVLAAQPGDWVLIAGKGHEDYQLIAGRKFDFDDRVVARAALQQRRAARFAGEGIAQ